MNKEINPVELDFLLRFPAAPNVTSPVDFIANSGWGAIKSLSGMEDFRNLVSLCEFEQLQRTDDLKLNSGS